MQENGFRKEFKSGIGKNKLFWARVLSIIVICLGIMFMTMMQAMQSDNAGYVLRRYFSNPSAFDFLSIIIPVFFIVVGAFLFIYVSLLSKNRVILTADTIEVEGYIGRVLAKTSLKFPISEIDHIYSEKMGIYAMLLINSRGVLHKIPMVDAEEIAETVNNMKSGEIEAV